MVYENVLWTHLLAHKIDTFGLHARDLIGVSWRSYLVMKVNMICLRCYHLCLIRDSVKAKLSSLLKYLHILLSGETYHLYNFALLDPLVNCVSSCRMADNTPVRVPQRGRSVCFFFDMDVLAIWEFIMSVLCWDANALLQIWVTLTLYWITSNWIKCSKGSPAES